MEQIGRYKILGEIGRGAMGVVYRAQDPAIGRVVAIKTIRLGELADATERGKLRDRLIREAQSAGMLSHPGIVTIYDVAEEADLNYVAMEFVDGPTLERMMAHDPPDGKTVLALLAQTAAALDYAHKRGIVHRDIKPANIMLHEGVNAKITDFGVARIQSHQMTQAGLMVGTPNYMSPEQIQGKPVDGRSDQFSLGVIAYELLTGEKPFTADSIPALAFKIVQEDPPQVHVLNRTLQWPVDKVLKRALAKDPAERFPTCSDFVFALENACRASKDWTPVGAAALHSMPTLASKAPQVGRPVGAAPVPERTPRTPATSVPLRPAARDVDAEEHEAEETPRPLRWARKLAVAAVLVGIVVLFASGALDMFDSEGPAEPQKSEPVTTNARPSPPENEIEDLTVNPPEPPAQSAQSPVGGPSAQLPSEPATAGTDEAATRAPTPGAAKPAASGPVMTRVVTNPPGATVQMDDDPQHVCRTPCTVELPAGRHTLAATMDGYRRTLKIFETPAEADIFLNLDRTSGTLIVRSEPRGASIVVDGQTVAEKTPAMLTLPTGRHRVEVVQDNRRDGQDVVIRESVITNLAISLQ